MTIKPTRDDRINKLIPRKELTRAALLKALFDHHTITISRFSSPAEHVRKSLCVHCRSEIEVDYPGPPKIIEEDPHRHDSSWHSENCIMRDVIREWKAKYGALE